LSDNPGLKRQDLKLIAVLSVPVPKQENSSAASVAIERPQSTNSLTSLYLDEDFTQSGRIPSRKSSLGEEEDWVFQDPSATHSMNKSPTIGPMSHGALNVLSGLSQEPSNSPSSLAPARIISLYKSQQQHRRQKRTVVVNSDADINPLRPCGACNEWLKKIAESNPYFTILTFTDSECSGVYCQPCEE
jgi:hypothetical protein